ncbi:serine hydrolase domain-containing protein [Staphylococcus gallinarum]|uniref:serine hydrolase domain-containing protein n=1 Tax=Staphylococcus gallinarum TaxID=1293 RepID=UPI002DBFF2E9|nr:serine hydrolase domain-containing protein [Staphylococcus gallinarum]MEB7040095.1 beta-lactamase family protein [Staphylococcus gallinarum]
MDKINNKKINYQISNIDNINNHLKRLINDGRLIGATYALSQNSEIFSHESLGYMNYNKTSKLKETSIRRIASLTKLFTSVAILQLIERGLIYLHQPIYQIIPEFNRGIYKKITLFHLLTHTSGLAPSPGILSEPYPTDYDFTQDKDWIRNSLKGIPYSNPGEIWAYSSFGFAILGLVIEKITEEVFEDYIKNNILIPLEMKDTFFRITSENKENICIPNKHSEKVLIKDEKVRNEQFPPKSNSGLYSTVIDLQKFAICILNKGKLNNVRILSNKSVEMMTKNHLNGIKSYCWNDNGKEIHYGLGFHLYQNDSLTSSDTFGHEGSGLSGMFIDPQEKFILTYFTMLPVPIWIPEPVTNLKNIVWSGIK